MNVIEIVPFHHVPFVVTVVSPQLHTSFRINTLGLADASLAALFQIEINRLSNTDELPNPAAVIRSLLENHSTATTLQFFSIDENMQHEVVTFQRVFEIQPFSEILVLISVSTEPSDDDNHFQHMLDQGSQGSQADDEFSSS